jgi:hypothetical protein
MKLSIEITDEFIQKTTAPGKQYCAFLYKAVLGAAGGGDNAL